MSFGYSKRKHQAYPKTGKNKIIYQSKDGSTIVYEKPDSKTDKLTVQKLLHSNDGRSVRTLSNGTTIIHSPKPKSSNVQVTKEISDIENRISELEKMQAMNNLKPVVRPPVKYLNPKQGYHDRNAEQYHIMKQLIPDTLYSEEFSKQNRMSDSRARELLSMIIKANNVKTIKEVFQIKKDGGTINTLGMK